MRSRRSLRSRMTKCSSSRARYSSNVSHLDRAAGAAAGRQEAVAVGHARRSRRPAPAAPARARRAADRERHDAAAVEEQQPADRPAEQQLALAVVEHRVPVHLLRERAGRAAAPPSTSGSTSTVALPRCRLRNARYSPFGVSTRSSASNLDAVLRARSRAPPASAVPSASNAADTGGPVTSSSRSVCRSAMLRDAHGQAPRRAEGLDRRVRRAAARSSAARRASRRAAASAPAASWPAVSSTPISSSSSRSIRRRRSTRRRLGVGRLDVGLRDRHRQLPDAQDVGRALGDADAAARVEHVEQVRALQAVLERRQTRPDSQQRLRRTRSTGRTGRGGTRANSAGRHVDLAERVLRLLDFVASRTSRYFTPGAHSRSKTLSTSCSTIANALEPVGQLGRDRREVDAAGLLEVGELRDLHAVEQHLPADAPRAERRRLPVVLLEADVVLRAG